MTVQLGPAALSGTFAAPASKSYSHRLLIAAALSDVPTVVHNVLVCEDTDATIHCLRALGAAFEGDTVIPIKPRKSSLMHCFESGTTLRLLLPVTAALGIDSHFLGSGRLPSRPIGPLVGALRAHGMAIPHDHLPLTMSGHLASGKFVLPGDVSSQFISGLLFALPLLDSGSTVQIDTPLQSARYVDMTAQVLEEFGIFCNRRTNGYLVPGGQHYRSPGPVTVEGDWSNAAPFLVAGAIRGSLDTTGLSAHSLQGDSAIAAILQQFGAAVSQAEGTLRVRSSTLEGTTVDVTDIPDLLPILAVLGAAAKGTTHLTGAARLRIKESDRLDSTQAMLQAIGADVETTQDTMTIRGGKPLTGGTVDSAGDHRIVMAAAIAAALCSGPVLIEGAEAVNKSFPNFFDILTSLGGQCHVLDDR